MKFSFGSFAGGVVAGLLLAACVGYFGWNYALSEVVKGDKVDSPLFTDAAHSVYNAVASELNNRYNTSIVGTLTSNDGTHITIEATRAEAPAAPFTFRISSSTQFYVTHDQDLTTSRVTASDITPGMRVSITANEPIASVDDQLAIKVLQS